MAQSTISEYVELVNRYINEGYTDGFPVIPPTPDMVADMVAASGLPKDKVLGNVPPRNVPLTVETLAINAVMAGCLPEYMPVIIAMMEAALEPEFNFVWPSTTTKGVAPLVIINGPIRNKLNINCKGNLFGPGFRANATIGRTLRLIINNVGGAKTQILDKSGFGHMGKYTYVIGEDEENSPWTPLHVEKGFKPEDSTVTLIALESPKQITNFVSQRAEGILHSIADAASDLVVVANGGYRDGEIVVIIGPEHRATLIEEGWDKDRIRHFLYENMGRTVREIKKLGEIKWLKEDEDDNRFIHLLKSPDYINIISAGGAAGRFSVVCDGSVAEKFCKAQTKKINV